jgi:hypothetical protein
VTREINDPRAAAVVYVDDSGLIAAASLMPRVVASFRYWAGRVGLSIQEDKTRPPAVVQLYLGLLWDTARMRVNLPVSKLSALAADLEREKDRRTAQLEMISAMLDLDTRLVEAVSAAPDPARLFQPLSPNEYQSLSGYQESRNAAWLQTFSASVNGRLFALPGGDAALAAVVEAAVEEEPMCALRQVGVLAPKLYDTMSLAVDEAKAACQPAAFFEACAVGIAGVHVAALMCAWLGQTMAEEVSIEDACSAIVTGHESQQRLQYICEKLCAVSMGCLMMSRSLPAGDTKAHLVLRAMFGGSDQSTEGVLPGGVEEAMQEMEAMMGNLCCVTDSEHALKTACVALAQAAHGSRPTRAALDWPLMPLASSDATDAVRAVIAGFRAGMASGSIQGRLVSIGIPTLVCGLAIATEAAGEEEAAVEDTAAEPWVAFTTPVYSRSPRVVLPII